MIFSLRTGTGSRREEARFKARVRKAREQEEEAAAAEGRVGGGGGSPNFQDQLGQLQVRV